MCQTSMVQNKNINPLNILLNDPMAVYFPMIDFFIILFKMIILVSNFVEIALFNEMT